MSRQLKGTIYTRGGGTYQLQFRYMGRLYRYSLGTTREPEAQRAADRKMTLVRAAIMEGTFYEKFDKSRAQAGPFVPRGQLKVADIWRVYLECCTRPASGASTLKQYEYQIEDFTDWMKATYPKKKYLSQVTRAMAGQYLRHLRSDHKLTENTHNKYLDTLNRTFRVLKAEKGIMTENPWEGITRQKWNRRSRRRKDFSEEEATLILSKADGWMKTLFMFGFFTGQRLVDCCLMKWEQIDFKHNKAEIIPHKTQNTSQLIVQLPLHPDLLWHLEELRKAAPVKKTDYVLPEIAAWHQRDSSTLVCTIQNFLKTTCGFEIHRPGTGTDEIRAVPQYGFHSCRHTFVSICRTNGVPDAVIKAIVGNSYELYTHVDNSDMQKAIDKIPPLLKRPGVVEPAPAVNLDALTEQQLQGVLKAVQERLTLREKNTAT